MTRPILFGVPVDVLNMRESAARCSELVLAGRPSQHVVINASKVVLMRDDERLRCIVAGADVVNADGMSVVWAGRWLGIAFPERVPGIDLMEEMLGESERREWPVYFLGATREVLDRFTSVCRSRFPSLVVAGTQDGYYDDERAVAERIAGSGARVLFIAMPSPKKEYFVDQHAAAMGALLSIGVGGSFDVWAGVTERAPRWMQKAGLEWFYRFAQEPGRMWRRYLLGNWTFVRLALRERAVQREMRSKSGGVT